MPFIRLFNKNLLQKERDQTSQEQRGCERMSQKEERVYQVLGEQSSRA